MTLTSIDGALFSGRVLNAPTHLKTVQQDQVIRFLMDPATGHAVMVTDKYMRERGNWKIGACTQCGFSELFDAPSDLARATFPNMPADAVLEAFTAFCPLCGGVQAIEYLGAPTPAAQRPWWKLW
ncbi:hypothetical protein [Variovorax rhizosphaerae]|uniref:Acetone carboxylase subunit gamma n=1 Tax=Variovorax rhizosphaerae TaxID=1836200 RepID=A0ABU8WL11_9BURK